MRMKCGKDWERAEAPEEKEYLISLRYQWAKNDTLDAGVKFLSNWVKPEIQLGECR